MTDPDDLRVTGEVHHGSDSPRTKCTPTCNDTYFFQCGTQDGMLSTIVQLGDVTGQPLALLTLPGPLRIGDRIRFGFKLRRQNGGRTEVLDAAGDWRVKSVSLDASGPVTRQVIEVENIKAPPSWRAVRKTPPTTRTLPPARAPRTTLA